MIGGGGDSVAKKFQCGVVSLKGKILVRLFSFDFGIMGF